MLVLLLGIGRFCLFRPRKMGLKHVGGTRCRCTWLEPWFQGGASCALLVPPGSCPWPAVCMKAEGPGERAGMLSSLWVSGGQEGSMAWSRLGTGWGLPSRTTGPGTSPSPASAASSAPARGPCRPGLVVTLVAQTRVPWPRGAPRCTGGTCPLAYGCFVSELNVLIFLYIFHYSLYFYRLFLSRFF